MMRTKQTFAASRWLRGCVALAAVPLLFGCEEQLQERPTVIKEVQTFVIDDAVVDGLRNMPARLVASQRVELSFRVAGKLEQLLVREGDEVAAGQVLAVLDQSDFKTALDDRRAAFEKARSDFDRAKALIVDGAISERDYDQVRAEFRTSSAAFEQAKVDLEYTVLRAPFNGEVATRSVENFEQVIAGQQVFYITDTSRMDVKFSVPENIMIMVSADATEPNDEDVAVSLILPDRPNETFPMDFKEFARRADPETKTYEVTYQVDQLEGTLLLPGMTATAQVELFDFGSDNFMVPTRVVFGDIYMEPHVWVYDEATSTVSSRPVSIGRNAGRSLAITGGVEVGDVLVSSHVEFLRDGETVALAEGP